MRRVLALTLLAFTSLTAACAPGNLARRTETSRVTRAWAAYLDGRVAEARKAFAQAGDDPRALYARALLAHESGELAEAWRGWTALLAAFDPHQPELALAAARRLETLVGEVPGEAALDPERVLALIDVSKLPVEARRRVVALRATYARRRGDEAQARKMDRLEGCPDRWLVAGPYGNLPRLDLWKPFAPESQLERAELREAKTRACEVTLDGPLGRAGVVYAAGWVKATRVEKATIVVETEQPWRLFVDGNLAASQIDEEHFSPRVRELELPLPAGWHSVLLKVAAPGGRAEVELATIADPPLEVYAGPPAQAPHVANAKLTVRELGIPVGDAHLDGDAKVDHALADLLSVEAALALGAHDPAEAALDKLLASSPRFAPAQLLSAQLALEDAARPANVAQDRARRSLERALSLDPTLVRARYMRALMSLNADRPREALSRLAEAPAAQLTHYWRFAYARFQALKARGWLREAEEALAEARKLQPDACGPIEAEVALRRERHDIAGMLPLARRAATCSGGSDDLADALRESGDLPGALAEYRRLIELDPSRESFQAGLGETLAMAGEVRAAEKLFTQLAQRYPRATHYRRQLADARVALGDEAGARRALEDGLAETPESQELRRALEALAQPAGNGKRIAGLIDPYRIDGKEVIAAYEKDAGDRPPYRSPAVIVLDRTVTRVFPTGARLTLTHNIIQVLAKDGIDKWGEVAIPEGADVLTLRTIKADGTTREPEEIAEKESVSVPDLEVGDYVELEYVDPAPPPGAFPRGFIGERFYFRSFDAPLDRTEYLLVTPSGLPVQIDARGDVPQMSLETREGLDWRVWAGRGKPQTFQEPSATPFSEHLPSVRAASGVSFEAWKDYLRDTEFGTQRRNRELEALAAREVAGKKSNHEKVAALDAWVRKHIKPGGPLDEPATSVLARAEGNRVTILAALLRAVGLRSEIWLARPAAAAQLDGTLPDLESFDQPLLWVDAAGGLLLDPRYRHSPTGFITPALRGAQALKLAPGNVQTAQVPGENPDDRHMEMEARLSRDGSADVLVREKLRGWPAVEWREALEKLASDRVRPEFEQRTLGFYFPGSTLQDLSWSGQDDDDGLFTVEYKFRSPQLARKEGHLLVLPAPYPAMLGRRYVGVAKRRTPLSIDYASPTVLSARVAVPPGVQVELPPAAKADGFGQFEQTALKTAAGIELNARFAMPRTRVPPDRYNEFVDFATRVDRAEARAAEIGLGK